jgi:hypothetical protein
MKPELKNKKGESSAGKIFIMTQVSTATTNNVVINKIWIRINIV